MDLSKTSPKPGPESETKRQATPRKKARPRTAKSRTKKPGVSKAAKPKAASPRKKKPVKRTVKKKAASPPAATVPAPPETAPSAVATSDNAPSEIMPTNALPVVEATANAEPRTACVPLEAKYRGSYRYISYENKERNRKLGLILFTIWTLVCMPTIVHIGSVGGKAPFDMYIVGVMTVACLIAYLALKKPIKVRIE